MKAIDRFYTYLAEKSLKPTAIEKEIGLSNGYLSAQKKRGADMGEGMLLKIIDYFRDINPLWLLTGEGSMLREVVQPPSNPVSASSDAMAMRLMDKLDKKESQIDQLQSELRAMEKELAVLKAKYQHPDEVAFAFTPGSSEAYTENSSPTKKPITPSKKLSAGKI